MAGRNAFAKLGVTRPEGSVAASNAVLHAAKAAGDRVRATGGSDAEAMLASRQAARVAHPGVGRSKSMGQAAHSQMTKAAQVDRPVVKRSAAKGTRAPVDPRAKTTIARIGALDIASIRGNRITMTRAAYASDRRAKVESVLRDSGVWFDRAVSGHTVTWTVR